jgi:hypothetical protein
LRLRGVGVELLVRGFHHVGAVPASEAAALAGLSTRTLILKSSELGAKPEIEKRQKKTPPKAGVLIN